MYYSNYVSPFTFARLFAIDFYTWLTRESSLLLSIHAIQNVPVSRYYYEIIATLCRMYIEKLKTREIGFRMCENRGYRQHVGGK